jgi:hypothetical protein
MPGWKMAARFCDVMRFWSDLAANTARRSRMYSSSWRFNGGSSVMSCWYSIMAASMSKFSTNWGPSAAPGLVAPLSGSRNFS